ncbi:CBS domain-containing protein [Frankia sp. AiPs1]|uniref:CBS domain-containing protein n=1 Tax=Frankia sp. AiPa1 TaxID=573492 RepID=UPI00202B5D5D|nr:CBS domain-containing protein [Frankia sp. AiPa1]MCL9761655.1 CBS domain-containing protein [Frankia sp. AiPa1]
MRADDVMTTDVCFVGPEVSVKEAAELLLRRHIRGLPVVNADGTLAGMVTEADLLAVSCAPDPRRHARRDLVAATTFLPHAAASGISRDPTTVGEIMSTPVVAARADADLADLARIMLSAHLTRLPILDDHNRLVGLVSRRDLVRLLVRADCDIADDVRQVLTDWYTELPPAISVTDGEVTLTGPAAALPDLLLALVRAIPGVIAVHLPAQRH